MMDDAGHRPSTASRGEPGKVRGGLSGSTLKIIAVITMLIDHTAAVVLARRIIAANRGYALMDTGSRAFGWMADRALLYAVYWSMRSIGRLGFPLFCFLLVEGFGRTKNVKKYALRLGIFALLSEIPFDLALTGKLWHPGYQNVYFTLLLGLICLCGFDFFAKMWGLERMLTIGADIAVLAFVMGLAEILHTDYSGMGVLTIAVIYALRRRKTVSMVGGSIVLTIMNSTEITAFLTTLPVAFYNGKRGLRLKYFFYVFYPVHLLLLYFISVWMGLGEIIML